MCLCFCRWGRASVAVADPRGQGHAPAAIPTPSNMSQILQSSLCLVGEVESKVSSCATPSVLDVSRLPLDSAGKIVAIDALSAVPLSSAASGSKVRRRDSGLPASVLHMQSGRRYAIVTKAYLPPTYSADEVEKYGLDWRRPHVKAGEVRHEAFMGGQSRLKLVQDIETGVYAALKVSNLFYEDEYTKGLHLEEVETLKMLQARDPKNDYYIDSLHRMETDAEKLYIVVPFHDFPTLSQVIEETSTAPETTMKKLHLALAIAKKVGDFHRETGVCHRDIKRLGITIIDLDGGKSNLRIHRNCERSNQNINH